MIGLLAPLLALAQPLDAAAPDSTAACLEQVRETVHRNQRLRVLFREGGSVEGDYRGVTGSFLELRTYERSGSRFLTQEIPETSIATIEYGSRSVSPWPPILGAILVGAAGVAIGSEFDDSNDEIVNSSGISGAVALGAVGALTGGAFGLLLSAAMGKTTFTEISCGEASPAP
jgi:hypothetical protein